MNAKSPLHVLSLLVLSFAAMVVVPELFAQSAPAQRPPSAADAGFVEGRVRNLATGVYLANTHIALEGGGGSTLTQPDGSFTLALPPGTHVLVATYAGLDVGRQTVTVVRGQSVRADFDLSSNVYAMQAFTVTGIREENALALQAERYAPNPKTVMSTSAFGRASANPGDLIQRMAGISTDIIAGEVTILYIRGMGPDFSSVLIDGESVATSSAGTRQHWIPQYGTATLSQVELIKAPTPDQDANAVAGYINLVSRRAFDQVGRRLNLSVGTTWADRGLDGSLYQQRANGPDQYTLSYSDVFSVLGGKRNLGVTADASYSNTTVMNEEVGSVYFGIGSAYTDPTAGDPLPRLFGAGDYRSPNMQMNFGLGAEYKLSDDTYVSAKFFLNKRHQYQEAFRVWVGNPGATRANFTADSQTDFATLIANASSTATSESFSSTSHQFNYGTNIGGEHRMFDRTAKLSIRGAYSYGRQNSPLFARAQAVATGIGMSMDRRSGNVWYPTFVQTSGPDISQASNYEMRTLTRQRAFNPNELYTLRADFEKSLDTGAPVTLKIGAKYQANPRKNQVDFVGYTFAGADGTPRTGDDSMALVPLRSLSLNKGRYGQFPFMGNPYSDRAGDPNLYPAGHWVQTATDVYNSYNTSNASNTELDEEIGAAYVSGNVNLGKLRILAGVRVENTRVEGTAWVRNQTASFGGNSVGGASLDPAVVAENLARAQRSFVARRTSTADYRHVFPGVHFVYEPADGFIARASYNRSISRPPVGNLLPTLTENLETLTVTVGNPALKPYTSDNFELGVEKYFEPLGKWSAGVFLKEIKNYFRSITTPLDASGLDGQGLYANYTLNQVLNVGDARVRGFELSYQQQFSFLPGFWRGFGAFANYTYTETRGNFGTLVTSTKLPLLTPRNWNAGVSYVNYGLQVRALANYRSRVFAGTNVFDFDRDERLIYDLKVQYSFNKRYNIYLDVANLTNEETRADIANPGMYWIKLNPGAVYSAGVNVQF